jgi:hypothetical protein
MINYEGSVNVQDAHNYWHGSWCWYVNPETHTVTPYSLRVNYDDDTGDDLFDDYECEAVPLSEGESIGIDSYMYPTGYDLFSRPYWKIQRFPIEYVPIGTDGLIRVSLSPHSSRMFKGLGRHHLTRLPLLDSVVPTLGSSITDRIIAGTRRVTVQYGDGEVEHELTVEEYSPLWELVARVAGEPQRGLQQVHARQMCDGIASVLEIGLPPVMRNLISLDRAQANSRRAVKHFMSGRTRDHTVLVPSFDMAIIRHRTHKDKAIVLRNGRLFGHLVPTEGMIAPTFVPHAHWPGNSHKHARRVLKQATETKVQQELTAFVDWEASL